MYQVLLPVDESESRALAQADYVAGLPGEGEAVKATLLYVFTDDTPSDVPRSVMRVTSVRRASERLEAAGVDVTVLEDSVQTVENILRHADEIDADTIVLGGRKRSPAGKAIFGSVTQSVIRNTERPVVVTGEASE